MLNREMQIAEGEMLLVHKPKGWTSFDVVNKIRCLFHLTKAGHAGTLDPMATGLLIVCTGKLTKEIQQYMNLEKEYVATMILGAQTESHDAETPIIARHTTDDITEEAVRMTLEQFVGYQTQVPPMWSAVKVGGTRLYKLARKGEEVERKPREIFIRLIELLSLSLPEVRMRIVCSKGTYVRTLAHDVGQRLGCGAYLSDLERVRLGEYRLFDAMTIDELIDYRNSHASGVA